MEYILGLSCTRPMKVPLSLKCEINTWTKVLDEYFSGAIFDALFVERVPVQIAADIEANAPEET
jgi:hypothetical protein